MTTIACYNFNNALEGATVYDDTGAHNGSVVGSVPLVDGPISQKGRSFSGNVANYIEVPHHADFKLDTDWTIEVWLTPTTLAGSTYYGILSKGNFTTTPEMYMGIYQTSPYVLVSSNSSNYLLSSTSNPAILTVGALHCLVATFKYADKDLRLYKDGAFIGSGVQTGTYAGGDNTLNLRMGVIRDPPAYPFIGREHAIRWSNVVKTPKQIFDTYMASNVQET